MLFITVAAETFVLPGQTQAGWNENSTIGSSSILNLSPEMKTCRKPSFRFLSFPQL